MSIVRHLYLIGPRGSGKTTVGRLLAENVRAPFVDLDQWIVERTGQTIADLFRTQGEKSFRDWETHGLRWWAEQGGPAAVISLGGGACQREDNQTLIRASGWCVWLRAAPRVLWDRIRGDTGNHPNRPALTDLDGLAEIELLVRERQSGYALCADYTVDTDHELPQTIVGQIAAWLQTVDK